MAISKKGRRKIVVADDSYVWWISPCHDDAGDALHIVSSGKEVHLLISLGQRRLASIVVISLGDRVGARRGLRGPWRRFVAPLTLPGAVTPKFIRLIIEWATSAEGGAVEITWEQAVGRERS